MLGLKIAQDKNQGRLGIGDLIQFTSIPENYCLTFGKKLVDVDRHWVFDHNPYVVRNVECDDEIDLWYAYTHNIPKVFRGRSMLQSNAEAWARHFCNFKVTLNRPRLYHNEQYPFSLRQHVLLHTCGISHGVLPEHVVKHVLEKYGPLVRGIGDPNDWRYNLKMPEWINTPTVWDLAEVISKARMLIGIDSGPSWIAMCYPDVVTKKVRTFPAVEVLDQWLPLELCRLGSYWDDRAAGIYNISENDVGFTWSYRRL